MKPFQEDRADHPFFSSTSIEDIMNLYVFDRELKLIVFDAIERIEVAVRTQIIYQMAMRYGSHWHEDFSLFRDRSLYHKIQEIILEYCQGNRKEVFIEHYLNTYSSPKMPPSWMSVELLTIGQLSLLYKNIRSNSDRSQIAQFFGMHHTSFESWLHAIAYVRNICAHHARLWNRELGVQPALLIKPYRPWIDPAYSNNRRVYYFLCSLKYLLLTINPGGHFTHRIGQLVESHPTVPIRYAGFSDNWLTKPLWQA